MRPSRPLAVAIIFTGLTSAGCGSGDASQQNDGPDSTQAGPDAAATEAFSTDIAIPVEAADVVRDTLVISVSAAAQAAAESEAKLLAQVEGLIVAVHARENDAVTGGRLLIEIDTTEYALGLARAEASFARAQASFRELVLFDDQLTDTAVRAERERVARAKSGLDEAQVAVRAESPADRSRRLRGPWRLAGRPGQNAAWATSWRRSWIRPVRVESRCRIRGGAFAVAAGAPCWVGSREEFPRWVGDHPLVDRET
jgi:multidrug efflux pump subunit AcrA (membrane-fusion protein)